jgi:uncharacterized repeat protein (TIGR01451 family)
MKLIIAFFMLLWAGAAWAEDVSLSSDVFVERVETDGQGKNKIVLEAPKLVTPGDKLLFVLSYKNGSAAPAADFVINNPIPAAVSFAGTDSQEALLSIDGGKSWGALASLKVNGADGAPRPARPEDVTNIKWQFSRPIPAGGEGKLSFRGVVK